jgi:hypothetical protein
MITDPVIVPTSGIRENRNAMNASSAGNGAPMIERKMKLSTPLHAARAACPTTYRPTAVVIWSLKSANRSRFDAGKLIHAALHAVQGGRSTG